MKWLIILFSSAAFAYPSLQISDNYQYFRLINNDNIRYFCWVNSGGREYTVSLYPGHSSPWFPHIGHIAWECRS